MRKILLFIVLFLGLIPYYENGRVIMSTSVSFSQSTGQEDGDDGFNDYGDYGYYDDYGGVL